MLGLGLALSIAKKTLGDAIDGLLSTLRGRATYYENGSASKSTIKAIDNADVLDKASILLTPTATSDARVHSVKTYTGDELISDNNFALTGTQAADTTGTYWTTGQGWTISNGVATVTNIADHQLKQTHSFVDGFTYKISFEITEITQGSLRVFLRDGGQQGFVGGTYNTTGVKEFVVKATTTSDTFTIYPSGTTTASVTSISVVDVSSDFDFDRASSATRINSDANVEDITSDLARINYDSNGDNGHILLEPTSTNLITYSEDFSEWASSNATLESGFLAPDGSNSAYKVSGTVGSTTVYFSGVPNLSSTSTRTIWARTVSGTGTINLCSYGDNSNNNFTITEEWQRFEVNGTTTSTGESNFYATDFRFQQPNALTEIIIWGAQAENLPYATSYIPTLTGSTVTRATETATGAGSADLINSTEGVLYAEIARAENDTNAGIISLNDGSNSNLVSIYYFSNNKIAFDILSSSPPLSLSVTTSNTSNFNKIALKYKSGDIALWVNGVEVITRTETISLSGLNNLDFRYGGTTQPFYGKVKSVAVFDEALSDSELTQLTT